MTHRTLNRFLIPFAGMLLLGSAAWMASGNTSVRRMLTAPTLNADFFAHWNDGKAELAGYDLVQPRYGVLRKGKAITVFVTEEMNNRTRVKSDTPSGPQVFPTMKLNLIEDYQTGVYDYNLMTSTFLRLADFQDDALGTPAKISFSAQEWCGHQYEQLVFRDGNVRNDVHSYFEGKADAQKNLSMPARGVAEDTLLLWARGMATPKVAPGEKAKVSLLPSLKVSTLEHKTLSYDNATLARATETEDVSVPAGTFLARRATATSATKLTTFWVEEAFPHRLLKWESSDGTLAQLRGSTRQKYWELTQEGHQKYLSQMGF